MEAGIYSHVKQFRETNAVLLGTGFHCEIGKYYLTDTWMERFKNHVLLFPQIKRKECEKNFVCVTSLTKTCVNLRTRKLCAPKNMSSD
jgi:hypothetical protein